MPKCPVCNKEIQYLFKYDLFEHKVKFFSETEQVLVDRYPVDYLNEEFECPVCDTFLFSSIEDAENFLKGGK